MIPDAEDLSLERLATVFAFSPHLYTENSRLAEHVAPEVWGFLAGGGRADGRLGAFVTDRLGLSPVSLSAAREMAEGAGRLWLLPGDALRLLARRAGIAFHAQAIGKIIDRDTVQRIKGAMSDAEYDFALGRAALLTRRPADEPIDFATVDDLALAFDECGWRFLRGTLHGLAEDVVARIALKMPDQAPWRDLAPTGKEEDAGRVLVLSKKILREISPSWAALFA